MHEEIGEKQLMATSLCNIGHIYIVQKKFPEARKYLNDGLAISKEIGMKDLIKGAYAFRELNWIVQLAITRRRLKIINCIQFIKTVCSTKPTVSRLKK